MRATAPFLPDRSAGRRGYYVTSMDRIGLAIGVAGLGGGLVTAALAITGGAPDIGTLTLVAALGSGSAMVGALVLVGPVWALFHRLHRRGPIVAALAASGVVAAVLLAGHQRLTLGSAALIVAAAITGVAMQRVAYRRIL